MSRATYRAIRARERARVAEAEVKSEGVAEDVPYRDLQAKAKELEIPANQSADDLKAAIAEAEAAPAAEE